MIINSCDIPNMYNNMFVMINATKNILLCHGIFLKSCKKVAKSCKKLHD